MVQFEFVDGLGMFSVFGMFGYFDGDIVCVVKVGIVFYLVRVFIYQDILFGGKWMFVEFGGG